MYTLHTTAGDTDLEAGNVEELLSELQRRRSRGEFLKEQSKKRWMAVSTDGGYLVARLDLRTKDEWTLYTVFGEHDVWRVGSGTRPPYVIHTTGGDVQTAAWSVQEFRIELARGLDDGRIPGFHDAPNMGRSRTVTQGRRRVGLIDWETGEFTPTDKAEEVAYWVRHGAGTFPMEADGLAALREELTVPTQSGAFLQAGKKTEYWVEVEGPGGAVERRVAAYSQEYREEAVTVPYMVHRAWSNVAGEQHYDAPLKCTAKETRELGMELGTLLHDGEFQKEEDCRIRWLPVAQGDWLVGYTWMRRRGCSCRRRSGGYGTESALNGAMGCRWRPMSSRNCDRSWRRGRTISVASLRGANPPNASGELPSPSAIPLQTYVAKGESSGG